MVYYSSQDFLRVIRKSSHPIMVTPRIWKHVRLDHCFVHFASSVATIEVAMVVARPRLHSWQARLLLARERDTVLL